MKKKITNIIKTFEVQLDILETSIEDISKKSEKALTLSKTKLKALRNTVTNSHFKTKNDEIHFFKYEKPCIYSRLIYYIKLYNIESKRPRGRSKSQKIYLDYEIKKLQDYFNDNLEFYQYFRRRSTFLDDQYFLRGKENIRLHPDNFHFFTDEKFSTSHDSTVATIMAYDMLIIYLKKEIDKLENNNGMRTINFQNSIMSSKLFWTGSKTDLIELIYALYGSELSIRKRKAKRTVRNFSKYSKLTYKDCSRK